MTKDPSLSLRGCSLDQLRVLFGDAVGNVSSRNSLVAGAARSDQWLGALMELGGGESEPGDLLLEMVCEPRTSLETLIAIKERAKLLHRRAHTCEGKTASLLLYNGAIAAGYCFHHTSISTRSLDQLRPLFSDLAQTMDHGALARLFRKAVGKEVDADQ